MKHDEYLKCIGPCVIEGNFTNHGPYIKECEKLLSQHLGDRFYVAIFGSSAVGTAVGIWLAGGLENYEGSYLVSELDPLIELLNQFSNICFNEEVSKPLRIFKEVASEDLRNTISSEVPVHVINGLCKTNFESNYHSELDYSILVLTDFKAYQESVSMRSSYGAGDDAIDVIATLNGRPSELVGQSILNVLKQ